MTRSQAVALLLAALTTGCGFSQRGQAKRAGAIRYSLSSAIFSLDPAIMQDAVYPELLQNVYQGLVGYDQKNRVVPRLATSWTVTNGGKTYVFKLRTGVRFSNGLPFTANDVKWSIERSCNPTLGSALAAGYLNDIVGVSARFAGKARHISGIRVIDPHTVEFDLVAPRPYFLCRLAYNVAWILCKSAAGSGGISNVSQMIGTGPYKITKIVNGSEVDLQANPLYYLGPPKTKFIERPIILDPSTELTLFKSGQLDIAGIQQDDIAGVKADPSLAPDLHYIDRAAVNYLELQEKTAPVLRDARVRLALALATDRHRIATVLLNGFTPADGFLPPGMPGYNPLVKGTPYDPARARKLLAEAGFPNGKGFPKLEFAFVSSSSAPRIATEAIAQDWSQNLGIKVQPVGFALPTFLSRENRGADPISLSDWYADYLDPQDFLSLLFVTGVPLNRSAYSNPQFDALCRKADRMANGPQRMALYDQAEQLLVNDAGMIPLWFQRDPVLVQPNIRGFRTNLMGFMPMTRIRIAPTSLPALRSDAK